MGGDSHDLHIATSSWFLLTSVTVELEASEQQSSHDFPGSFHPSRTSARLPLPFRGPRAPGERHVLVLCGCRRAHGRTHQAVACQGGVVNDAR